MAESLAFARNRHFHALAVLVIVAVLSPLLAPSQAAGTPFGSGSPEGTYKNDRIRGEFFGMGLTIGPNGARSWPGIDLGAVRIPHRWSSVERTPNVYDWDHLDVAVSTVESHGAAPLIVIEGTPLFHAVGSNPTLASPPRLRPLRKYVRALVARYGDRADYHVWNEANVESFFTGTPAKMARMTKIVSKAVEDLAPTANTVAPSFPLRGENPAFRTWFRAYWKQTLGKQDRPVSDFVDVASVSAYPMQEEDPEDGLAITQWARRLLENRGFDGPLWVTEINYGANGLQPTSAPLSMVGQVSFVVRTYVLHATAGADRVYWWRWEGHPTVNTLLNDGVGGLTAAGTAFGVVEDWLIGTRPSGCTVSRGVTGCEFRARKGVKRIVYWTRSGRSRKVPVPAGARTQTDPTGTATQLSSGSKLRVDGTPIMIEVRS